MERDSLDSERIEKAAQSLSVPETLRGDTTVREFLGMHVAFSDFLEDLSRPQQNPQTETNEKDILPNIGFSIQRRYEVVVPLIEMARAMVEEELHLKKLDPNFVKGKLDPALELFGLYVEDQPSQFDIKFVGFQVDSEYYKRVWGYASEYEKVNSAMENERLNQPVIFDRVQRGQDVTIADYYGKSATLQEFTKVLNGLSRLQSLVGNIGENTPVEPGSYVSNDVFQRERIAEMLKLASLVFWEGIGTHARPAKIIQDINYALDRYNLHVDIKPHDISIPEPDHEISPDVRDMLEAWKNQQKNDNSGSGKI